MSLTKKILFAGSLIAGYYIGGCTVQTNTETKKYEIIQKQETNYLKNKETQTKHILREIDKETYMGNIEHLTQGVRELAIKKQQNKALKGDQYE